VKILIIGGTRFVGHAMAEAALAAGHDVTLLHRHATDELPDATHLLADRDGDLAVLADGRWDATIDVCAYLPGQVTHLADALGDRGGHHVFVSTGTARRSPSGWVARGSSQVSPDDLIGAVGISSRTCWKLH
jgi:2'-hydroxyisoflavone reductase